jgi:hypothetical protein
LKARDTLVDELYQACSRSGTKAPSLPPIKAAERAEHSLKLQHHHIVGIAIIIFRAPSPVICIRSTQHCGVMSQEARQFGRSTGGIATTWWQLVGYWSSQTLHSKCC